jgi:glycosyltransferase involved in cell wall biosynthesis
VPLSEVPRYMRCMDIFVLASYATPAWKEQFGLALAQAMLLGIPSVVSSCGAIPEVAGPGARVCREGSVESLAEGLRALLESPILRRDLGAQARAFALQNYTLDAIGARYLEIFYQARCARGLAGRNTDGNLSLPSLETSAGSPGRRDSAGETIPWGEGR